METGEVQRVPETREPVPGPSAEALDPVLEVFKRGLDFSLVEKNLGLSIEERAQQLVNATRFIGCFRPLVRERTETSWRTAPKSAASA